MSAGGHMADMFNRYKQNKQWLKEKKDRMNKVRQMYVDAIPYDKHQETYNKEISKEELAKIKDQIRKKLRRDRIINISVFVLLLSIILGFVLYWILYKFL